MSKGNWNCPRCNNLHHDSEIVICPHCGLDFNSDMTKYTAEPKQVFKKALALKCNHCGSQDITFRGFDLK